MGYVRYDSREALAAMNALYRHELRLFQNLFLPSVKLVRKIRVGSRVRRVYDHPQTLLGRVLASPDVDPVKVAHLKTLRERLDPFALPEAIDQKITQLYALAHHRSRSPKSTPTGADLTSVEKKAIQVLSESLGIPVHVGTGAPQAPRRK